MIRIISKNNNICNFQYSKKLAEKFYISKTLFLKTQAFFSDWNEIFSKQKFRC